MTNLDLYAKTEHLLGIEEATDALHSLYMSELDSYEVKTLLDVGCGRGGFLERALAKEIEAKGCDLSSVMVQACQDKNLDVTCSSVAEVDGSFDAVVAIFDVLNFITPEELEDFLDAVADKLEDDGVFIADINTKFGFSEVADGVMSNEDASGFLNVEAQFVNNELTTTFTFFEKNQECYKKYQDSIVQYFHPIKSFQKHKKLKLVEKQTFSLYDVNDKTLLIMKKR
jgi:cyclopropane fatty-acyl-phospholipid synthase-like methyltransferase